VKKTNRKQDILQALAHMLETDLGDRITTARLAKEVGVSEAALYRHFPSKARMYEALMDFCEESIFSAANNIAGSDKSGLEKCTLLATFVLNFAAKNPGISRVLTGEVLFGENGRLKQRVNQIFDKLNLQFKQMLKIDAVAKQQSAVDAGAAANLLAAIVEGKIQQFVRSNFARNPVENWQYECQLLCAGIG
jgi:TetR/AcrR family transcriptional regulator